MRGARLLLGDAFGQVERDVLLKGLKGGVRQVNGMCRDCTLALPVRRSRSLSAGR